MLPLKEGTGTVWPRTGLPTKHHGIGALPYRGGVWGHDRLASGRPKTPIVRRLGLSTPSPDPRYRIRQVKTRRGEAEGKGAARDRSKGTEQPGGDAKPYRVDLRPRDASGAAAKC